MANPDALNSLTALSPLDGRYRTKVAQLSEYFSEYGLMRERIRVELAWLDALADEPGITEIAPFASALELLGLDAMNVERNVASMWL